MRVCKTCNTTQANGKFCPKGHVLLSDPPDDMLIGRVLDGRYEVRSALGAGGFGMVYLAAQLRLQDRPCVIKVARPELAGDAQFAARFRREKQALMALRCPNTVQIIDYGRTDDGIDYIVMEYIDGEELNRIIRKVGRLAQERALRIAQGICRSLEEAHCAGILHRDLKPSNVMLVDPGGTELVKVIDFGIARLGGEGRETEFHTRSGEVPGTPAYCPYEQIVGKASMVDHRSDLYSFGAILYEMLAGVAPFGDRIKSTQFDSNTLYIIALAQAKAEQSPTPPSALLGTEGMDPELEALVLSLLSTFPDGRPDSARLVRDRLDAIQARASGSPTFFPDDQMPTEKDRPPRVQTSRMESDGSGRSVSASPAPPPALQEQGLPVVAEAASAPTGIAAPADVPPAPQPTRGTVVLRRSIRLAAAFVMLVGFVVAGILLGVMGTRQNDGPASSSSDTAPPPPEGGQSGLSSGASSVPLPDTAPTDTLGDVQAGGTATPDGGTATPDGGTEAAREQQPTDGAMEFPKAAPVDKAAPADKSGSSGPTAQGNSAGQAGTGAPGDIAAPGDAQKPSDGGKSPDNKPENLHKRLDFMDDEEE